MTEPAIWDSWKGKAEIRFFRGTMVVAQAGSADGEITSLLDALTEVRSRAADSEESNRREIETIVAFAESNADLLGTLATHGMKPQDSLDRLCAQRERELKAEQKKGTFASGIDPVILARAEVGQLLSVIQWWLENDMHIPRQKLVDSLVAIRSLWIRTPQSKPSKPS